MKKICTIIILSSFLSIYYSMGQCNQISMIGEFSGWAGDLDMIRDTVNPDLWTLPVVYTTADDLEGDGIIQMKFREHGDWSYAWGNSDFPSGVAVFYGPNIPVPYGAWDVSFNCVTLEYNFQVQIGVDESADLLQDFEIYPNPASSSIKIVLQKESTIKYSSVSIYDMKGQKLINFQLIQPKIVIDISALSAGIYFVKMTGEKRISIEKLIKID